MRRVVARDRIAFDTLYERHAGLVYGLCLRVLGDEHEAEQVLVDVFHELWRKPESFHPQRGHLRTYLVVLARSRAIDRLRQLKRVPRPGAGHHASAVSAEASPADRAIYDEAAGLVRDALTQLPENERRAIEKVYYEGLTHRQLAEELDAPLGTVKTWVRRALGRVRGAVTLRYQSPAPPPDTTKPAAPHNAPDPPAAPEADSD